MVQQAVMEIGCYGSLPDRRQTGGEVSVERVGFGFSMRRSYLNKVGRVSEMSRDVRVSPHTIKRLRALASNGPAY